MATDGTEVSTARTAGVQVRTLVVAGLPLLAVAAAPGGDVALLRDALIERGIGTLPGFLGQQLPRGAKVGFQLDAAELRLLDEAETTLLRVPRAGTDDAWREHALRLKGTMLVVADDALDLSPGVADAAIAAGLDACAQQGGVVGAIVGVASERPTLPLLFG